MSGSRKVAGAAGGAVGLGAFATLIGACCAAPWTVGLLGVAAAVALARLSFMKPYLLAAAAALLVLAFWRAYRTAGAQAAGACPSVRRGAAPWIAWGAAALLAALAGFSFAPPGNGEAPAATPAGYVALDDQDGPLRADFNRAQGAVRLLFVVDPACPTCLRGLADLNDALLAGSADTRLQTFVVHEPVIGGTSRDIAAAARLLHNPNVRHYWNATGEFGRRLGQAVGLRRGSDPVYAWDVWLMFGPDAVWGPQGPPRPRLLMHQLQPIPGFSFLDGKAFAQQAQALVAPLPPVSAR